MMHPDNRPALRVAGKALMGLIAGGAVGLLLTNAVGWQVSKGFQARQVETAIVAEQIEMCLLLARRDAGVQTLDFDQRYALAKQYAQFPWDSALSTEVLNQCANGLAERSDATAKKAAS